MQQYLALVRKVLFNGSIKTNRTSQKHFGYTGDMMKFDLREGFPILTTKKVHFRQIVAEMLGFFRGIDNAAEFRRLGSKVWDENANNNEQWLKNPNRKGEDDLGRIYGVQARRWIDAKGNEIDQLRNVYNDLVQHKDNRREIVSHWNPGEMDSMALPPCHLLYQFGITPPAYNNKPPILNMSMYQRSCDVPLGIPYNITGYAFLLFVMAKVTNCIPGELTMFLHDIHVYENQMAPLLTQLQRDPKSLPKIKAVEYVEDIRGRKNMTELNFTFEDLETSITPDNFILEGYNPHPAIKYEFSV